MARKDVDGDERVIAALEREIVSAPADQEDGLRAGARVVRREAIPITPRLSGYLRSRFFVVSERTSDGARAGVFNDAEYAAKVHESVEMRLAGVPRPPSIGGGTYWDSGEPKFLEKAMDRNRKEMLFAIAEEMRERRRRRGGRA